jgi:hypothetical protein
MMRLKNFIHTTLTLYRSLISLSVSVTYTKYELICYPLSGYLQGLESLK